MPPFVISAVSSGPSYFHISVELSLDTEKTPSQAITLPKASWGPHTDLPGHAPAKTCSLAACSHRLQQIPPALCVSCSFIRLRRVARGSWEARQRRTRGLRESACVSVCVTHLLTSQGLRLSLAPHQQNIALLSHLSIKNKWGTFFVKRAQ